MIVVADTSPLQYLILIEHVDVLPALYGRVIVPPAVLTELAHERAPASVRTWLADKPEWLQVQTPNSTLTMTDTTLGPGESAAIALAEELSADALLIDDRAGRREAEKRRLAVLGTLRVLADAAEQGLLDLQIALRRLALTNFQRLRVPRSCAEYSQPSASGEFHPPQVGKAPPRIKDISSTRPRLHPPRLREPHACIGGRLPRRSFSRSPRQVRQAPGPSPR